MNRHVVWGEAGERAQREIWTAKLEAAAGNISDAAKAMGFTKSYAMRLTRRHSLNAFAADLRQQERGRSRGRPWPVSSKTGK